MKKNCCWVYYKWIIPVILEIKLKQYLTYATEYYATKKELDRAIGIDTSDLAAKKRFYCFKSQSW